MPSVTATKTAFLGRQREYYVFSSQLYNNVGTAPVNSLAPLDAGTPTDSD